VRRGDVALELVGNRALRTALLALALLAACAHGPKPSEVITRLVVRDADARFQAVRTIRDPATLARITELWVERRAVDIDPIPVREYRYALDISVDREQARWMYRPDGFTTLLALKEKEEPTFAVKDPAEFNALLGIGDPTD
jgi:hypothetical protein